MSVVNFKEIYGHAPPLPRPLYTIETYREGRWPFSTTLYRLRPVEGSGAYGIVENIGTLAEANSAKVTLESYP